MRHGEGGGEELRIENSHFVNDATPIYHVASIYRVAWPQAIQPFLVPLRLGGSSMSV
jgi:hypothetical protein